MEAARAFGQRALSDRLSADAVRAEVRKILPPRSLPIRKKRIRLAVFLRAIRRHDWGATAGGHSSVPARGRAGRQAGGGMTGPIRGKKAKAEAKGGKHPGGCSRRALCRGLHGKHFCGRVALGVHHPSLTLSGSSAGIPGPSRSGGVRRCVVRRARTCHGTWPPRWKCRGKPREGRKRFLPAASHSPRPCHGMG